MRTRIVSYLPLSLLAVVTAVLCVLPSATPAQDRLPTMPGYAQYSKMGKASKGAVKLATADVEWMQGGKSFDYYKDGKRYHYDIATNKNEPVAKGKDKDEPIPDTVANPDGLDDDTGGPAPVPQARGRQLASANSPDGKFKAYYRDRNLWISSLKQASDSKDPKDYAVTTDGSAKDRTKYGTASWVYGEELAQTTAIWWSPDSKKVGFYRFDESGVRDYYLPINQSALQDSMGAEPYPKAGAPNPIADIYVYDVETKKKAIIDVRDGKSFDNNVVGHYAYHVTWSPDGKELQFNRTNRRQNVMEFVAANPETGKCRVIVHEEWLPSWVVNTPQLGGGKGKKGGGGQGMYLKDKNRFIWPSERTGFRNFYLYDLSGKLLSVITNLPYDVANIVRVDENAGLLYYMAHSGDNHMKLQLHRVGLDGKGDKRLTDPAFNHSVNLAPDGQHFIDLFQTHDTPPSSRLVDAEGTVITELTTSDLSRFHQLGLRRVELITYKAGDGKTELHGMLHFPSNFDPNKKYPLLVSVYGGPNTSKAKETFTVPSGITEYGFLFAELDSRSASGRGKQFTDAIYLKLGVTEIDDQAAGVKSLWNRPYLAKDKVGIYGTSYGGYASVMCILRYPDVFQAASGSSPVTDWRHYDSIYTERYMWIPQENKDGYKAGSAMSYAHKLKGRLMLFYGTQDDNVHPSNTLSLILALQEQGKSFELQVGPDKGHSGINQQRMMEFFIENLVMRPSLGTLVR